MSLKFLSILMMMMMVSLASGEAQAQNRDVEAGPIWNQRDAETKCPRVCKAPETWTGAWRTTRPGRMSVCACGIPVDMRWAEASTPWVDAGWKPFQPDGLDLDVPRNDAARFAAGFDIYKPVAFVAICHDCDGVELIWRDDGNAIIAREASTAGATLLSHVPYFSSDGVMEVRVMGCGGDRCKVRLTAMLK